MDYRYTGQNNMYQPGQQPAGVNGNVSQPAQQSDGLNNYMQQFEQLGQAQSKDIQYNFGQQGYVRQDFEQGNANQQFGQSSFMQQSYGQQSLGGQINGYYSYAQKDNSFPTVNLIVSIAGLALMAFLFYMMVTSTWGFIYKVLIWILFDGIVSLQVLMLALAMGKRDKNPGMDFKPVITFNICMLVLYGIGFIAYHVYFIVLIVNFFKGLGAVWA